MLLGQFNFGSNLLRNSYFRALGKLSFGTGCIAPIVIMLMYHGQEYSLSIDTLNTLYLALGNIISVIMACIPLYLIVEHPLKCLLELTILPKLSHDSILRRKYMPSNYIE